jgi:DNA-binding IclR family transcriptional regulator
MVAALPGTQAVARAVALLKAFSDVRPAWRLTELARAARLHKATAHRLLAALEHAGMVARDATGEWYRLGPEAIALGARAARANDLRSVGHPELEALAAATGETATLEVPVAGDMLIVDEVPGRGLLGAAAEVGTRWAMHATSTGKALLAALPAADVRRHTAGRLARFTPRTVVTAAALARALAQARRCGYATSLEELEIGFAAVGAAVRDASGQPVAAISVGGPRARFSAPRLAALGAQVRAAADHISRRLGATGAP